VFGTWYLTEFFIGRVVRAAPQVPSSKRLREAVIREINENFPGEKKVIDIGSCYGGLARKIAKECPGTEVVAVERMLLPSTVSKISDFALRRNSKTYWANAFDYIEKSEGFDIGVAYLLTPMMARLEKYKNKFKVLILLDFPLPNTKETRKVKLHRDYLGQHWMYIYEF
jgi:tRNA A22 N-methylase